MRQFETLEPRTLMAASIDLNNGTLDINGTNSDDQITIENVLVMQSVSKFSSTSFSSAYLGGGSYRLPTLTSVVRVTIDSADGTQMARTFDPESVNAIDVEGLGGSDNIRNLTSISSTLWGGAGHDTLRGGSGSDVLYGGAGNDNLYGNNGYDTLYGWDGNDLLEGGNDGDFLDGQLGRDTLRGGNGDDTLQVHGLGGVLGAGFESLDSLAATPEYLEGGYGNDNYVFLHTQFPFQTATLGNYVITEVGSGSANRDTLNFEGIRVEEVGINLDLQSTSRQILTEQLSVTISNGYRFETVIGTDLDDVLRGSSADNVLYGGGGDDLLEGRGGDDLLFGDVGSDTYYFSGGNLGSDLISESNNAADIDTLDFSGMNQRVSASLGQTSARTLNSDLTLTLTSVYGQSTGIENAIGTPYNDYIYGNSLDNFLQGGDGNDSLYGSSGHDRLFGDYGADYLSGGSGRDGLFGGDDNDVDTLNGGSGADRFLLYHNQSSWLGPYSNDTVSYKSSADVNLNFYDAPAETITASDGTVTNFGAGSWSSQDVQYVDEALAIMARRTGNNALLQDSGRELEFHRWGSTNTGFKAFNRGGRMFFSDATFSSVRSVYGDVFHEIGHNFDDENPAWNEFMAISGWTSFVWWGQTGGLSESTDGHWWYDSDADFARNYGAFNPYEDFATAWEAYFLNYSGITTIDTSDIQDKIDFIDDFLDTL